MEIRDKKLGRKVETERKEKKDKLKREDRVRNEKD